MKLLETRGAGKPLPKTPAILNERGSIMDKVYLLYGIRSFFDGDYAEPDFTLLAIYDSREKAEAAKVDWESESDMYDEYEIVNWKVQ